MRRILAVAALTLALVGTMGAEPAAAHIQWGGNCHINFVRESGVVGVRLVNRLFDPATVECGLKTNDGQTRYVRVYLAPRSYVNRRVYLSGSWTVVRITHVHIYR